MGALRDDNYFVVHGWMINRLGLKGNELRIYAIIYGFSQADGQKFKGSLQYLADWTSSTRPSVLRCLQSLVDKGLLVKDDTYINGVKFCEYHCNFEYTGCYQNDNKGVSEMITGCYQNDNRGVIKMGTKKELDKESDNESDKEDKGVPPAPAPERKTTKAKKADTEAILARYAMGNEETMKLLREWLKVRKAKRAPETEKALTLNLDKLQALAQESRLTVNSYLEAVIMRGWAAFFPIRENMQQRSPMQPTRSMVKTEQEHAAGMSASGMGGW